MLQTLKDILSNQFWVEASRKHLGSRELRVKFLISFCLIDRGYCGIENSRSFVASLYISLFNYP